MKTKLLTIFLLLFSSKILAESFILATPQSGLIIKNFRCTYGGDHWGTVVNRNNFKFKGCIIVKYYDEDQDPIGQSKRMTLLEGQSGEQEYFGRGNCKKIKSYRVFIREKCY